MQVETLVQLAQKAKLSPLQRKVLEHLDSHPADVFEYRDDELIRSVGGKVSSVSFSLWALHKRGLIDKELVAGKVYFGSRDAIAELRGRLGVSTEDPFARATENLRRLREEIGTIDVLELLDDVRKRH